MKRILLIFVSLWLAGCTQALTNAREIPTPLSENFELSQRCPRVCWLDISPGTTTLDKAVLLLQESEQVDSESIQKTKDGIELKWLNRPDHRNYVWVILHIDSKNDVVQTIRFIQLHPYTVHDFVDLLGQPDDISISLHEADGTRSVTYALYYSSLNAFFYVNNNAITTGPNPEHTVSDLYLNLDIQNKDIPQWIVEDYNNRRIWLGFGNLDKYLPQVNSSGSP